MAITKVLSLVWDMNHFAGRGRHTEMSALDLVVPPLRPFVQKACTFTPGPHPGPVYNKF